MLHMFQLGIVKTSIGLFYNRLTSSEKTQLDAMGRRFHNRLRQCHRSVFPTTDFSRGITNIEQKQGHEYTGLLFVLCALMNNGDAWHLIHKALTRNALDIEKVLELFECLLVFGSCLLYTSDAADD